MGWEEDDTIREMYPARCYVDGPRGPSGLRCGQHRINAPCGAAQPGTGILKRAEADDAAAA